MFSPALITTLLATTITAAATTSPHTLNVTVIAAQNNHSTLECWALEPGFTPSTQSGTAGDPVLSLGAGTRNMSYMIIPAHTDGGRHNAPTIQWVTFLSGLAHITLSHSDDEAWIPGGKHGTILAIDTADVSAEGHNTEYPSEEATVTLALPVERVPRHRVLYGGACVESEMDY
ncbi:hypothetical protein ETB97_004729 [Aspergillus alliaceus]|uniref:Uncharacterized protein n=1 Tax=Petromyces alliaceus TaxID=209559 RepID=A0A5N6GBR3_PETAA|nr:uncharacterized protein BDW43DRAFT_305197 [Aspergillus alliaceus]KAB8239408.1 hypothetical protein BDW43DRAFT_305197 [Aspergillus alliaceus]KAF5858176.1 hypothetical protein ETB97_004729 [Aspergillus burnettii]